MSTFTHEPHPHTLRRLGRDDLPDHEDEDEVLSGNAVHRFNTWLAVKITNGVGTMWCAYLFAVIAFLGLPQALRPGGEGIVAWIAQTFLQLVLLSIIIVGQNIAAASTDKRSEKTYKDAEAILSEALEIQRHLESQDQALTDMLKELRTQFSAPGPDETT